MSTLVPHAPLLTVPEAAERLRVSEKTVRRLIDGAGLPALRVGGQIRLDKSELESWLYSSPGAFSFPRPWDPAERRAPDVSPAVEARPPRDSGEA